MPSLRRLLSVVLLLLSSLALAQSGGKPLTFAISEGTSGGLTAEATLNKYRPLVDLMEKTLGQEVKPLYVRDFNDLEKGLREQRFDLLLARPSDYPARGLRDYRYRLVTTGRPDGHCVLLVRNDSPLKTLADVKGKRFIMPEKAAYLTRLCRAELRDKGILLDQENVSYTKEQGAIPFALENGISDVGGVSTYSGVYPAWLKKGHRVLHQSGPQPYMPLVAAPGLGPEQLVRLRGALMELDKSDSGRQLLQRIGVQGFNGGEDARLRKMLEWLEK